MDWGTIYEGKNLIFMRIKQNNKSLEMMLMNFVGFQSCSLFTWKYKILNKREYN